MRSEFVSSKFLKIFFLFLLASSLASTIEVLVVFASAQPSVSSGLFRYDFAVDENGFTEVDISYQSNRRSGSSWVLVPKSQEWTNRTTKGKVTQYFLRDTENYTNNQYYFYEVLHFYFASEEPMFEMHIQFNFSTAAMIIEPNGVFYSPQIGFQEGNDFRAEVIFPTGFSVNRGEAIAYGITRTYQPNSGSNSKYVLFDYPAPENLIRIGIGFKTAKLTSDLIPIKQGIFTFDVVRRYESYATEILDLYNETYEDFVKIFNVTLEDTHVQFFLPNLNSLFSVLGYVSISGEELHEININIVSTRQVKGYIEVTALHELVHHFLWKAGVSPQGLLWFHEGMAQYVSVEVANILGYEGADMERKDLERLVTQLEGTVGNNMGFLKEWTPSHEPRDTGTLYVAAYYVVSRLAEPRGGLEYYASFFKSMNGKKVVDNAKLSYYLGLAANGSVVATLNSWGFGIPDLYALIYEVEKVLDGVNPIYQPYKFLAEQLYEQALSHTESDTTTATRYLAAATLIARLAPTLTLITISGVLFGAILTVLKKEGVFQD